MKELPSQRTNNNSILVLSTCNSLCSSHTHLYYSHIHTQNLEMVVILFQMYVQLSLNVIQDKNLILCQMKCEQ